MIHHVHPLLCIDSNGSDELRCYYLRVIKGKREEQEDASRINNFFDAHIAKEFSLPEEIDETQTIPEGAKQRISVDRYERSAKARRECIAEWGASCRACGISLAEIYGQVGKGFVHVHHLKLLSEVGEGYKADPKRDLIPVCPNCHAMIHKRKPPYTLDEIKVFLHKQKATQTR